MKAISYDRFMDLARTNYDRGGAGYATCWDDRTFEYFNREYGPITEERAQEMFRITFEAQQEKEGGADAAAH